MSKSVKDNLEQLKNKAREELLLAYLRARIRYDVYKLKYQALKNKVKTRFMI